MWGFPFFIIFDRIAYGRLQTLASVELSFLSFLFALHGRLQILASVGLTQAHPNYLFHQSYGVHITSLVINNLGGWHTHVVDKMNF